MCWATMLRNSEHLALEYFFFLHREYEMANIGKSLVLHILCLYKHTHLGELTQPWAKN